MSTSLIPFANTPSPQQQVEALRRENERLREEISSLQRALSDNVREIDGYRGAVSQLREALNPLYSGLRRIYGDLEIFEGEGPTPKSSAVWESWKQKLGGQTAEAIDVLHLHGEMNAEQLRIHLRCARTHVYNVISRLNKAGIINKNGGRISLKEL